MTTKQQCLSIIAKTGDLYLGQTRGVIEDLFHLVDEQVTEQTSELDKQELFEQIATYFEKQKNWNHFKENCWLENGRSEDFRQMLKYAMGLEEEPQNGRDWINSRMTESIEC